MFNLASIYRPLTAQANILECLPCDPLKPYIANYWGTEDVAEPPLSYDPILVIPDTCMDVIFDVNHTTGTISGGLCGMDENAFTFYPVRETQIVSRFSIRFYFWSIHFFSGYHLRGTIDHFNDVDIYFKGWKTFFTEMLLSTRTMNERIKQAERFLLSKLNMSKSNNNVMNALYHILNSHGSAQIREVCAYTCVSQRQLERLFLEHIGTSIKKTSNLVRYQNLWRDIVFLQNFDVQDAVEKYGYTDQSHLLNSFKKYHNNMTLSEARNAVRTIT